MIEDERRELVTDEEFIVEKDFVRVFGK